MKMQSCPEAPLPWGSGINPSAYETTLRAQRRSLAQCLAALVGGAYQLAVPLPTSLPPWEPRLSLIHI